MQNKNMEMLSFSTVLNVLSISAIGIIIFSIAFAIMVKISPFSVKKEIEEDQNTSLAILYGSVFIGLAIISAKINKNDLKPQFLKNFQNILNLLL